MSRLFATTCLGLFSALLLLLTSCGFQPRAITAIPFSSIRVSGGTQITEPIRILIKQQGIKIIQDTNQPAELDLELIREESEKRILSLSGQGVVREFELYYRVHYRTRVAGKTDWNAPLIMEARRDYTYSDANLLAKQAEELRLNKNMQTDVMQGIMRRLAALKK